VENSKSLDIIITHAPVATFTKLKLTRYLVAFVERGEMAVSANVTFWTQRKENKCFHLL